MEQTTTSTAEAGKRPTFLTVLCILSFIAAGLAVFGYIGTIALVGMASAAVSAVSDAAGAEGAEAINNAMATYTGPSVGLIWAYIIVGFLTTLVGLFGVIQMWKLKKIGFFIYVGCSVVALIMGIVFSGVGASVMSIIFTALFIVLYGLNLKHLK